MEWSPPRTSGSLAFGQRFGYQLAPGASQDSAISGRKRASLGPSSGRLSAWATGMLPIGDVVAEGGEAFAEAGDAQGGWPHVDAAAALAEIERGSDDGDVGVHGSPERCRRKRLPHDGMHGRSR